MSRVGDRCHAVGVTWTRVHMWLAIIWTVMAVPTLVWWRNSVLFVAFISLYANIVAHLGAYQSSRAARAAEDSGEDQ